jgi:hypothetical protein
MRKTFLNNKIIINIMTWEDLPYSKRKKYFFCIGCKEVVNKKFMSKTIHLCNRCAEKGLYHLEMVGSNVT